jgi:hypothetical protein
VRDSARCARSVGRDCPRGKRTNVFNAARWAAVLPSFCRRRKSVVVLVLSRTAARVHFLASALPLEGNFFFSRDFTHAVAGLFFLKACGRGTDGRLVRVRRLS